MCILAVTCSEMQVRRGAGATYWGILVIAVVISVLVTFSVTSGLGHVTTPTTSSSDQALIDSLLSQNAQLQKDYAAVTQSPNSTFQGLNSVKIYQVASAGVVTWPKPEVTEKVTRAVMTTAITRIPQYVAPAPLRTRISERVTAKVHKNLYSETAAQVLL